jgi:hypothetical protein
VLVKTLRDVLNAMLSAYQVKDKKQGSKNALEIYTKNMGLIEETRNTLVEIDDLVAVLQGSLNAISERRSERTQIKRGSIVSKLVPCGKHCSGCPHGPYLYKVTRIDGKQVWTYLGRDNHKNLVSTEKTAEASS